LAGLNTEQVTVTVLANSVGDLQWCRVDLLWW